MAFAFTGVAVAAPSEGLNTGAGPWQWVRPGVQGAYISAESFVSATTGWAVGLDGLVLKTTDGGTNWASQPSGTTYNLTGVDFTDANNGWAVGVDGNSTANVILHTTDGGATWVAQAPPATGCSVGGCNNIHLSGVSFANTSRGVIAGDGYAFYTINGGATWTVGTNINAIHVLTAVQMIDASTVWAVGNAGVMYFSGNNGQNWNEVPSGTTANLTGLYFTTFNTGFAVGNVGGAGHLVRLNGSTMSVSTAATANSLTGVAVAGTTLIASGYNGSIYTYGTDIFNTSLETIVTGFATPPTGTTSNLLCVTPATATAIYAGGDGGAITASTNTGGAWNLKAGGDAINVASSSFISATEGWMAGNTGSVLHTTDGGTTWTDDNTGMPADVNIHGLQFLNNTTGYAVGCQGAGCSAQGVGVAYKYSSGTWSAMTTPTLTNASLNGVHMTSSTSGWAVGYGSTVLRTSDGTSWVSANTGVPANFEFNSVDATNAANDGWTVGQLSPNGPAVAYKYSGGTWSAMTLVGAAPAFLTSIDMIDANTGYLVGDEGYMCKTVNGGTDWTLMTSGTSKLLASVSFVPGNANIGYAVGAFGRVIHTRDAGATWYAENLGTNLNMLTVSALSERVAYAGGDSGGILRSLRPYYFTWYDDFSSNNWVLMANPNGAASDLWFSLFIAGTHQPIPGLSGSECAGGPYAAGQVPAGCTAAARINNLVGGPVNAASMTSDKAIVSQRIIWPKGGSSLEEVLGQDIERLSDHFFWTWYDQKSPGWRNWVLVANPNPFPIYYDLKIGGNLVRSVQVVQPGANDAPQFANTWGGPVEVQAYNTSTRTAPADVMASQRVLMNNDNAFNEALGIPMTELSSDYLWTWYDQASAGAKNWILIANPPGDAATNIYYKLTIAGVVRDDGSSPAGTCKGPIADNANRAPQFPGLAAGPVEVNTYSDAACTVPANSIASQRISWNNGLSFGEVTGYPRSTLKDDYWWTWYDENSPGMANWVLVANPTGSSIYYEISVAGVLKDSGTIAPGANSAPRFASLIGGPVHVQTWTNSGKTTPANSMASQRVLYNGYFNEVLGTTLN